jgi:ATP-dependent DNA ligase
MNATVEKLSSIEKVLEGHIKFRKSLAEVKGITQQVISNMSKDELISNYDKVSKLWASIQEDEQKPEWIINTAILLAEEMIRRGLKPSLEGDFGQRIKKSIRLFETHANLSESMNTNGEIVIDENYINLVGSAATKELHNDIDILINQEFTNEDLIVKLKSKFPKALSDSIHPFFNGGGPHGKYISLYRLVAQPKFDFDLKEPTYKIQVLSPVKSLKPTRSKSDLSQVGLTDLFLEPHIDGEQIQIHKKGDKIELFNDKGENIPYLALREEARELQVDSCVMIGELSSDQTFWAHDLVWYNDTELSDMPLSTRKHFLSKIKLNNPILIKNIPNIKVTQKEELSKGIEQLMGNGFTKFMLKGTNSQYDLSGNTEDWNYLRLHEIVDGNNKTELSVLAERLRSPFVDYANKSGKFVIQKHYRGLDEKGDIDKQGKKSLHVDFRFKVNDHLEGFELVGAEDKLNKLLSSPKEANDTRYVSVWKKSQPKSWMNAKGWIEPGEVGSTKNTWAFFEKFDSGTFNFGVNKPDFQEIFLNGKKFKGRYVLRQLTTPPPGGEGPPNWQFWKTKDDVPYCTLDKNKDDQHCKGFTGIKGYPGQATTEAGETNSKKSNLNFKIKSVRSELNKKNELVKTYTGVALAEGTWNDVWYRWEDIEEAAPTIVGKQIRVEHEKKADDVHGYINSYKLNHDLKEMEIEFSIFTKEGQEIIDKKEKEGLSVGVDVESVYSTINGREESRKLGFAECSLVESPACKRCWTNN